MGKEPTNFNRPPWCLRQAVLPVQLREDLVDRNPAAVGGAGHPQGLVAGGEALGVAMQMVRVGGRAYLSVYYQGSPV